MNRQVRAKSGAILTRAIRVLVAAVLVVTSTQVGPASADVSEGSVSDLPDAAPLRISELINDAELQDLKTAAAQKGISLAEAAARYAWNDNFALAVDKIREAVPQSFTGAEVIDGTTAWVGFLAEKPPAADDFLNAFSDSHVGVNVEVRTDLGFTELDLEKAIEDAHFLLFGSPSVSDVSTSFDFESREITSHVVLRAGTSESTLDALEIAARGAVTAATQNNITLKVKESASTVLSIDDSANEHLGGEDITGCTMGFGVRSFGGTLGVATAGHCSDSQTDDGHSMVYKGGQDGTLGDFQWHTGPKTETDDFYSGNSTTTEVNRRDVSGIGNAVVGQLLCRNGVTSKKDCQDVRKTSVCAGNNCNLVQMEARLSAGGDSGGPMFFGTTAYGFHTGGDYDPWPFLRDVFSKATRIDDALHVNVRTS